ncbi:hypothetical protein C1645_834273 [Glomus cerebriforme]|uniref:Reverse transcriptase domain-containing protein n=1 Tax=Glomus cerebriforme TaxID=658196 RepID=A0A397SKN3_9GLOM|nr:hypothetical protein C1645_834273 [Glomus cerebriforme]
MINSILNRKPKTITLNKLSYKDTNGQTLYTTDPNIIEKETIKHYQTLGNPYYPSYDEETQLPSNWQDIYLPQDYIKDYWFDNTTQPITLTELTQTLHSCPNNKAPGISGIRYEDLKHINESFNEILTHHFLPHAWNRALLFPIPKLKPFNCDLNNIRPIILLENIRKLFVKIISNRLNNSLSLNNVLQFNNQAGLIGQSMFEPI